MHPSIAAYRFGNPEDVRSGRLAGRSVFPKRFKKQLVKHYGARCSICQGRFEPRYLQIDHRVPYEVGGESAHSETATTEYALLCGECNRAKSWSCEHCINWIEDKRPEICLTCYWAKPESYLHIALQNIRRLDIVWNEAEVEMYEKLKVRAESSGDTMPEYVKWIISKQIESDDCILLPVSNAVEQSQRLPHVTSSLQCQRRDRLRDAGRQIGQNAKHYCAYRTQRDSS